MGVLARIVRKVITAVKGIVKITKNGDCNLEKTDKERITMENEQKTKYVYCLRCHRRLKSEESKELGYGKTCIKKMAETRIIYKPLFDIQNRHEN